MWALLIVSVLGYLGYEKFVKAPAPGTTPAIPPGTAVVPPNPNPPAAPAPLPATPPAAVVPPVPASPPAPGNAPGSPSTGLIALNVGDVVLVGTPAGGQVFGGVPIHVDSLTVPGDQFGSQFMGTPVGLSGAQSSPFAKSSVTGMAPLDASGGILPPIKNPTTSLTQLNVGDTVIVSSPALAGLDTLAPGIFPDGRIQMEIDSISSSADPTGVFVMAHVTDPRMDSTTAQLLQGSFPIARSAIVQKIN